MTVWTLLAINCAIIDYMEGNKGGGPEQEGQQQESQHPNVEGIIQFFQHLRENPDV